MNTNESLVILKSHMIKIVPANAGEDSNLSSNMNNKSQEHAHFFPVRRMKESLRS